MPKASAQIYALSALLLGACAPEGIHTGTSCQFLTGDDIWVQYEFQFVLKEPTERDCPLSLSFYGQSVFLSADVTSPVEVFADQLVWRHFDAEEIPFFNRVFVFGLGGPQGRRLAQPQGYYPAGLAGDVSPQNKPNQDLMKVDVSISSPSLTAVHRTFLPYKGQLTTPTLAFTGLPRAKKNRATTIRLVPGLPGSPPPSFQWYRNGVAFTPPSNPWNVGGLNKTAFTFTPTNTNPINWKVRATYGFPSQAKTIEWQQLVDP